MTREQGNSHDRSSYLPRQLLALSVCAAFGLVAIVVYRQGSYTPYVLWSGIAVLTLVAAQIIFSSLSLGRSHFDRRIHERSPWQYAILGLPVILWFLVPLNHGVDQAETSGLANVIHLDFENFIDGANDPDVREQLGGKIGVLKGQYAEGRRSNLAFGLFRLKGRHEKPLSVSVVSDVSITTFKGGAWVQVTGEIEYQKRENQDEYYPVLKVRSLNDVVPTQPVWEPASFE
jgi:hypothetical protein